MPFPRLAIVLSHPVQYYCPWFRWLRTQTSLEFRVFYLWDFGVRETCDPQFGKTFKWDLDLLSGYDHEFVPNIARDPGTHHFRGLNNPALTARLSAYAPEAVLIYGYSWLSHLRVIWWARRHHRPLVFRGDSHLLGRGEFTAPKRWLLQHLYAQFSAITYVGAANREYFHSLSVPEPRLFFAPHSVEADRFTPDEPAALAQARQLRAELGLTEKRVVLFAGKFNPGKQPVELLRAFLEVAGANDALVFVGAGALRDQLAGLAATRTDRTVCILPFANQTEMPARYLLADLLALPSRETWGLVVNEAMHCGRPCLVSDLVGCQRDLVTPGETGWVSESNDPTGLTKTLQTALRTTPAELARLSAAARARVAHYTYTQTTAGLLAALGSLS